MSACFANGRWDSIMPSSVRGCWKNGDCRRVWFGPLRRAGRRKSWTICRSPPARCRRFSIWQELLAGLLTENRADLLPELLQASERFHHITPGQLKLLVTSLQTKVEQRADALSLELPATGDYNHVLVTAHSRLSEVAADAAGDLLRARQASDSAAQSESLLAEVQSLRMLAREAAKPQASLGIPSAPPASGLIPRPSSLVAKPTTPTRRCRATRRSAAAASVTGDPALLGALRTIVASCRQFAACGWALMLVEHLTRLR